MQENSIQRRTDLAVQLLSGLRDIHVQLNQASHAIEKCSGSYFEKLFKESRHEIQNDIDTYKSNIERIKQLNSEITLEINTWYDFVKDASKSGSLSFPVLFHIKKRKLKSHIKNVNQAISDLSIQNRFIKEHLTNWEHELELKAIQQLKHGTEYDAYEKLISTRAEVLAELEYLLPTLPDICPAELNLNDLDGLIERLSKTVIC